MAIKKTTNKGHLIEEALRVYFLGLGFYVLRGVEFSHKTMLTTDIDLWLYNRPSSLTRERINVDIKNKRNPQATERIFWTKGVQTILGLDNCIVATTDKRPLIKEFGDKNKVIVLDGNFLNKVKEKHLGSRFTEEEFIEEIMKDSLGKISGNWTDIIKSEKSSLLSSLDYSGCISSLENIRGFMEYSITMPQRKTSACRVSFLFISYFLIKLDYLLKDLAFYDNDARRDLLDKGMKYGNFGEKGLQNVITTAKKLAGLDGSQNMNNQIMSEYDKLKTDILGEYFSKYDVVNKLFALAKQFENLAFSKSFENPNQLSLELKSIISVLLDYYEIKRSQFFDSFNK